MASNGSSAAVRASWKWRSPPLSESWWWASSRSDASLADDEEVAAVGPRQDVGITEDIDAPDRSR